MLKLNLKLYLCFTFSNIGILLAGYCEVSPKHVFCLREGYHPRCGDATKIVNMNVNDKEKQEILDAHNRFRSLVAEGNMTDGYNKSFPQAANMEELVWDIELSAIAEELVKDCVLAHSCNECRMTSRYRVGENLQNSIIPVPYCNDVTNCYKDMGFSWKEVVQLWALNETMGYDLKDLDSLTDQVNSLGVEFVKVGHLTQVIWANTKRVGCASIAFERKDDKYPEKVSNCLYGPVGNVFEQPVYTKGRPCSMCEGENRTCSVDFPNLCSEKSRIDVPPPPASIFEEIKKNETYIRFRNTDELVNKTNYTGNTNLDLMSIKTYRIPEVKYFTLQNISINHEGNLDLDFMNISKQEMPGVKWFILKNISNNHEGNKPLDLMTFKKQILPQVKVFTLENISTNPEDQVAARRKKRSLLSFFKL